MTHVSERLHKAARPLLERCHTHPFLRGYFGADYQTTNDALMDQLADSCGEEEYRHLEGIFATCSHYELGFWEMAWTLET